MTSEEIKEIAKYQVKYQFLFNLKRKLLAFLFIFGIIAISTFSYRIEHPKEKPVYVTDQYISKLQGEWVLEKDNMHIMTFNNDKTYCVYNGHTGKTGCQKLIIRLRNNELFLDEKVVNYVSDIKEEPFRIKIENNKLYLIDIFDNTLFIKK